MRTSLLITCALTLIACGTDSESPQPEGLEGTWGGLCELQGSSWTRVLFAFDGARFAIRRNLYETDACTNVRRFGASERVTTGSYSEVGPSASGAGEQWNTAIDQEGDNADLAPRPYDLYFIEAGLLFYGDYSTGDGSSEAQRPITRGSPSVATWVGSDTSEVFP